MHKTQLFVSGIPGCGKSTFGRRGAARFPDARISRRAQSPQWLRRAR